MIQQFLVESKNSDFSYSELEATRDGQRPAGYNIDHYRIQIGSGSEAFEKAKAALTGWKMFDFKWVTLHREATPIQVGCDVAIVVQHFGFYSLNAARIVYLLNDVDRVYRFGLAEHGEIGEERFSVEFHEKTGEVWYDLFAFSRPASFLARAGYPLSRYLQRSFAADSKLAMLNAVSGVNASQQNV